jgi:hypothetical protein
MGVLVYFRFDIKTFVVYIVHDHVHAAQVVGGRVHFLTVKALMFLTSLACNNKGTR